MERPHRFSAIWFSSLIFILAMFASCVALAQTNVPQANPVVLDKDLTSFSLSSDITALSWSPDGRFLAVTHDLDRRIELLDAQTGRQLWAIQRDHGGSSPAGYVLEFSEDGYLLYIAAPVGPSHGREGVVGIITTKDGRLARVLNYQPPPQGPARARAVTIDAQNQKVLAVSQGNSSKILAYDNSGRGASVVFEVSGEYPGPGKGFSSARLAIDRARDRVFWSHSGVLQTIRLSDWRPINETQAFQVEVQALEIDPMTGEAIVGGSAIIKTERYPLTGPLSQEREYRDDPATLVRAYDPEHGKLTRTFSGPGGTVYGVAISPDGKLVAAAKARMLGKSSSHILVWDAHSQKLLSSRDCGLASVGGVAFDPSGLRLAFAVGRTIHITKNLLKR